MSMIGKLDWEVIQESDKLWIRIMKHKYLSNNDNLLHHVCQGSTSYVWRSITKATNLLKHGFNWRVGDGSAVSLWYDKWFEGGPLCDIVTSVPEDSLSMKVADIIISGAWNLDVLEGMLDTSLPRAISSMPLS